MILSTSGICWTPSPRRQGGLDGIHQVVNGNIFLNDFKYLWDIMDSIGDIENKEYKVTK
jgi:hypothetical protein